MLSENIRFQKSEFGAIKQ